MGGDLGPGLRCWKDPHKTHGESPSWSHGSNERGQQEQVSTTGRSPESQLGGLVRVSLGGLWWRS